MRASLILAAALIPIAAHAQPAPQISISQPTAEMLGATLQQSCAALSLMRDAVAEPQRQAAAAAAAREARKAEDAKAPKPAETSKP